MIEHKALEIRIMHQSIKLNSVKQEIKSLEKELKDLIFTSITAFKTYDLEILMREKHDLDKVIDNACNMLRLKFKLTKLKVGLEKKKKQEKVASRHNKLKWKQMSNQKSSESPKPKGATFKPSRKGKGDSTKPKPRSPQKKTIGQQKGKAVEEYILGNVSLAVLNFVKNQTCNLPGSEELAKFIEQQTISIQVIERKTKVKNMTAQLKEESIKFAIKIARLAGATHQYDSEEMTKTEDNLEDLITEIYDEIRKKSSTRWAKTTINSQKNLQRPSENPKGVTNTTKSSKNIESKKRRQLQEKDLKLQSLKKICFGDSDKIIGCGWSQFSRDIEYVASFIGDIYASIQHDAVAKTTYFRFYKVEQAIQFMKTPIFVNERRVELYQTIKLEEGAQIISISSAKNLSTPVVVDEINKIFSLYGTIIDFSAFKNKITSLFHTYGIKFLFNKNTEEFKIPEFIDIENKKIALTYRGCVPACSYCKKVGHWRTECPEVKKNKDIRSKYQSNKSQKTTYGVNNTKNNNQNSVGLAP
ncbi:hypothetical protein BB561_006789, partial [Smittium simulii]